VSITVTATGVDQTALIGVIGVVDWTLVGRPISRIVEAARGQGRPLTPRDWCRITAIRLASCPVTLAATTLVLALPSLLA
jgi:hypothetical protein